jgi:hypothetical protein
LSAVTTVLPHTKALRDVLLDMLDRPVEVVPTGPWAPTPRDPGAIAVYVDDRLRMRALISSNLALSAVLGGSIGLVPPERVLACVESGQLTAEVGENLAEVFNILAGLFNVSDRPHVKVYAVHLPADLPAADVSARLRAFGKRSDLEVSVAGYGAGRLSMVLT